MPSQAPRLRAASPIPALTAALAIAIIASATLAGAWFFQLVLDIRPCPLCLEQRYAFIIWSIPLGGADGARRGRARPALACCSRPGLAMLALAALGNAGLGTYHAGVEWAFWWGPTDCTGPVGNLGSAGDLLEQSRHRQGGPLRRGAVAFPRHFAGRLQRADLAVDGGHRGLAVLVEIAAAGHANRPRPPAAARRGARCRASRSRRR